VTSADSWSPVPHTTQIAWNLSTTSAMHMRSASHRTAGPEVDVGAGEMTAYPPVGEAVRQIDDAIVEELCSSTAATSVVSRTRREISSAESTGSASTVTPSCDETEKRPAYRASR